MGGVLNILKWVLVFSALTASGETLDTTEFLYTEMSYFPFGEHFLELSTLTAKGNAAAKEKQNRENNIQRDGGEKLNLLEETTLSDRQLAYRIDLMHRIIEDTSNRLQTLNQRISNPYDWNIKILKVEDPVERLNISKESITVMQRALAIGAKVLEGAFSKDSKRYHDLQDLAYKTKNKALKQDLDSLLEATAKIVFIESNISIAREYMRDSEKYKNEEKKIAAEILEVAYRLEGHLTSELQSLYRSQQDELLQKAALKKEREYNHWVDTSIKVGAGAFASLAIGTKIHHWLNKGKYPKIFKSDSARSLVAGVGCARLYKQIGTRSKLIAESFDNENWIHSQQNRNRFVVDTRALTPIMEADLTDVHYAHLMKLRGPAYLLPGETVKSYPLDSRLGTDYTPPSVRVLYGADGNPIIMERTDFSRDPKFTYYVAKGTQKDAKPLEGAPQNALFEGWPDRRDLQPVVPRSPGLVGSFNHLRAELHPVKVAEAWKAAKAAWLQPGGPIHQINSRLDASLATLTNRDFVPKGVYLLNAKDGRKGYSLSSDRIRIIPDPDKSTFTVIVKKHPEDDSGVVVDELVQHELFKMFAASGARYRFTEPSQSDDGRFKINEGPTFRKRLTQALMQVANPNSNWSVSIDGGRYYTNDIGNVITFENTDSLIRVVFDSSNGNTKLLINPRLTEELEMSYDQLVEAARRAEPERKARALAAEQRDLDILDLMGSSGTTTTPNEPPAKKTSQPAHRHPEVDWDEFK